MKVIILLEGSNPLKNLPSYKYFEMSLKKDGIQIHNNIRLIRIDDAISFERGIEIETLPYDYLLFISKPVPKIPKIDNKEININDIDFKHNKLSFRTDISLIGDSSFMFTAAEAEYHAQMTVDNWINNKEINLKELSSIPFCLHGSISLGMASNEYYVPHNLTRWIEIDFKEIGWSSIGNYPGKLWYVKCEKSNMILSLHICHSHSNELISIGKILMNYPLDHDVWLSSFIHPSASEIFKKIAEKERIKSK